MSVISEIKYFHYDKQVYRSLERVIIILLYESSVCVFVCSKNMKEGEELGWKTLLNYSSAQEQFFLILCL